MQKKPQLCKNTQSCLNQFSPKQVTFLLGDIPRFQGCECEKCPGRRMGQKADSIRIFWFYWPYDGLRDRHKPAEERKADWEPLFVVSQPDTSEFFLVTTVHWKYVCWGPWNEYKLRFFLFWHTPMIEGKLRERLFQRLEKIYGSLSKLGKFYFGVVSVLERLAFYSRKVLGKKAYSIDFTPASCLSEIPNKNPRMDPEEPISSLKTRRNCIKFEKIKDAINFFRKLM